MKDYFTINCDSLSEIILFHTTITYETCNVQTCNVETCKNDTRLSTEYWQLKQNHEYYNITWA